jgi:hypothetical protein
MFGVYKARVVDITGPEAQGITRPSGWTTGWLLVRHKGNLRWARPSWPIGQYRPPSDAFLSVWAEKLSAWVIGEQQDNPEESDDSLVYLGFEFHEDCLPDDVAAAYPKKQLLAFSNLELVVTEDPAAAEVEIRYIDDDASPGTPAEKPIRFKLSKADKKLTLALDAGTSLDDVTLELSGVAAQSAAKLGTGDAGVALGPALRDFWANTVKPYIDGHKHQAGTLVAPMGPVTGETGSPGSAPDFSDAIISTQLLVPNNP